MDRDIIFNSRKKLCIKSWKSGRFRMPTAQLQTIEGFFVKVVDKTTALIRSRIFIDYKPLVATLENFPHEILTKIFTYCGDTKQMTRLELVCKRWRLLVHSMMLSNVERPWYKLAACRSKRLQVFVDENLGHQQFVYQMVVGKILDDRYSCTTVILSRHFSRRTLHVLLAKIRATGTLLLVGLKLDVELVQFISKSQNIVEDIRFLRCEISDYCLRELSTLRDLKGLALDSCVALSENAISTKSLLIAVKSCSLVKLEISTTTPLYSIDDKLLQAIAENWHKWRLQYLRFQNCPKITNRGVNSLVQAYCNGRSRLRLVIFFDKTSVEEENFLLETNNYFKQNFKLNFSTTRVLFKSGEFTLWLEK